MGRVLDPRLSQEAAVLVREAKDKPAGMLHAPHKIPKLRLPREKNTYDVAIQPTSLNSWGGTNVDWEGITGKVTR